MGQCSTARHNRRIGKRAGVFAGSVLALGLLGITFGCATDVSWRAVASPGNAMMVAANTHATAGAWIARYYGLKRADESDRTFITTMKVYMEHCACHLPDKPIYWQIAEGLNKCFRARERAELAVAERCRYSGTASERAGLEAYKAEIDANRPVVLTFCYDPAAAADLSTAKRRVSNCFSVVGIGYMKHGNTDLLICHDGLQYPPASGSATLDRVPPEALGINTQGRPWGQTGTTLYKWDGAYKNLVMVFVRD